MGINDFGGEQTFLVQLSLQALRDPDDNVLSVSVCILLAVFPHSIARQPTSLHHRILLGPGEKKAAPADSKIAVGREGKPQDSTEQDNKAQGEETLYIRETRHCLVIQ